MHGYNLAMHARKAKAVPDVFTVIEQELAQAANAPIKQPSFYSKFCPELAIQQLIQTTVPSLEVHPTHLGTLFVSMHLQKVLNHQDGSAHWQPLIFLTPLPLRFWLLLAQGCGSWGWDRAYEWLSRHFGPYLTWGRPGLQAWLWVGGRAVEGLGPWSGGRMGCLSAL